MESCKKINLMLSMLIVLWNQNQSLSFYNSSAWIYLCTIQTNAIFYEDRDSVVVATTETGTSLFLLETWSHPLQKCVSKPSPTTVCNVNYICTKSILYQIQRPNNARNTNTSPTFWMVECIWKYILHARI